jgi:Xaa-Pro dipeptidase
MISRRDFVKIGSLSIIPFGFVKRLFSKPEPAVQAKFENMVAGVKPLTPEDYEHRLEKAQRLMAAHKIDGLFLTGGANLVYFASVNWGTSERTFGALLNLKKKPVWVCPGFELDRAKELIPEGQEIRIWEEDESPYKLISEIMKTLGTRSGSLAISPSTSSFVLFGIRKDAPSLELVDGAVITEECRGTKTEKEIAYMDLANKITKLAYREGFKHLREGMSPRDLSGTISAAHQQMGVSGGGGPQFGPNTAFPHGSRVLRTLNEGDMVMVDGGCSVEGYRSDVTRTIVFGRPSDKQRTVWDIVKKAQSEALKAARPGASCEDVDRAARKVIEDAGFGPGYKYFSHRVGHGIGLEGHEYPYLVKGNKLKLQPGMTFSDEPGIYIPGEFGIRTEDCMVITENGARLLGGMEAVSIESPFAEG